MGDGAMHGQAVKADHVNAVQVTGRALNLTDALIDAEGGFFVGIRQHGNSDLPEQGDCPLDQIHVAIGQRIKTSRVERPHPQNPGLKGSYAVV